jgi:hypothetical protein
VGTWHDSGLGLLIAAPLERCAELLGVDLASLRETAAKVEFYTRAVAPFHGRDQVRGHALLHCVMVFYTLGGIALLMGT